VNVIPGYWFESRSHLIITRGLVFGVKSNRRSFFDGDCQELREPWARSRRDSALAEKPQPTKNPALNPGLERPQGMAGRASTAIALTRQAIGEPRRTQISFQISDHRILVVKAVFVASYVRWTRESGKMFALRVNFLVDGCHDMMCAEA
jgi:hypothetical protein